MRRSTPDVLVSIEPEPEWVTHQAAAQIIGCSPSTVRTLARSGRIVRRHVARRSPSLDVRSVRAVAGEWREQQQAKRDTAIARAQAEQLRDSPPDSGHVWLRAGEAAALLGVMPTRVHQRARRGRIPCVEHAGRRWFRRRDIEVIAAAKTFRERVGA